MNDLCWLNNKVWHAGNDGSGSGLDADLLDGRDSTAFFRSEAGYVSDGYVNGTTYTTLQPGAYIHPVPGASDILINLGHAWGSASALELKTAYPQDGYIFFRKTIDSNRFAGGWDYFITNLNIGGHNAGSATQLQMVCTIWGQSFNGTGNVSGDLWGAGNINFSNNRQIGVFDRYQFGAANQSAAVGINVGSLLVSNAWADEPNVPANGIYCKGEISSPSVIRGYSYWANGINSLGNYPYITFHIPNVAYTQIYMDGSGVLHLRDGSSQSSGYKSLHALDIYAHSWLRTYGSAGWYNETYYGGWYMTDYDWIRVYNGKKVFAENTIASGTSFDRSQYGGSIWNDGIAAYNVSIHNNSSQTPLLMGYRSGVSAVGANRLFVMEFLNTGSLLRYCFGGSHKFEMYSDGDFWAAGEITALSDRRAKTDINTLPCRGALIPRTYIKDGKESIGFVAQEVQILYPELVRVGSDGLLRLNYDGITAVLQAQVNDHEARLQKLEATMNLN